MTWRWPDSDGASEGEGESGVRVEGREGLTGSEMDGRLGSWTTSSIPH